MAWRGVAWRGVAWRGVAWRGVAWRGVCSHEVFTCTYEIGVCHSTLQEFPFVVVLLIASGFTVINKAIFVIDSIMHLYNLLVNISSEHYRQTNLSMLACEHTCRGSFRSHIETT